LIPAQKKQDFGPQFHDSGLNWRYAIIFTNARLIILYALRAKMIDFARSRVDGISETIV
jgi:hypothetical protein